MGRQEETKDMKGDGSHGVRCLVLGLSVYLVVLTTLVANAGPLAAPSFSRLVQKAKPSVVNISTARFGRSVSPDSPLSQFDDSYRGFLEGFFGGELPHDYSEGELGTGFFIDREGHILTANHVIEGADEIKVTFDNKEEHIARVIGRDPKTDLALVKVDLDSELKPLPLGDSDAIEAGDWVVAIGNPFGLGNTVTAGIVSAEYRHLGISTYDNFIQIDASINPGNSGGPLLNMSGEVIGINSAIYSQVGGNVGIGFAIPINTAKRLLPHLRKGKIVRGWLGTLTQGISPQLRAKLGLSVDHGALVGDVDPDGPGFKAGIRRGDVIVVFGDKEIREHYEFPLLVAETPVGSAVDVVVFRKAARMVFTVTIGELHEPEEARAAPTRKPNLGLDVKDITPDLARTFGLAERTGILVVDVDEDSVSGEAGIEPGDIIVEVDEMPMHSAEQLRKKLGTYEPGQTVLLLIKREGLTSYVTVKVREG